jgi:hypothetical protein
MDFIEKHSNENINSKNIMKVRWTKHIGFFQFSLISDRYPEADSRDFDKHYEGEVIGSNKDIFGDTYLLVKCTDGKIRECEINKATVI